MLIGGNATVPDHLLPILIDHLNIFTTNALDWSVYSGKGWSI
jgi:hypothetical protein